MVVLRPITPRFHACPDHMYPCFSFTGFRPSCREDDTAVSSGSPRLTPDWPGLWLVPTSQQHPPQGQCHPVVWPHGTGASSTGFGTPHGAGTYVYHSSQSSPGTGHLGSPRGPQVDSRRSSQCPCSSLGHRSLLIPPRPTHSLWSPHCAPSPTSLQPLPPEPGPRAP